MFNDEKTKFHANLLDLDMDTIDQVITVFPNEKFFAQDECCFAIANGKA